RRAVRRYPPVNVSVDPAARLGSSTGQCAEKHVNVVTDQEINLRLRSPTSLLSTLAPDLHRPCSHLHGDRVRVVQRREINSERHSQEIGQVADRTITPTEAADEVCETLTSPAGFAS